MSRRPFRGVKGANSVKIIGPNLNTLEDLATKVVEQMQKVKGVADLGIFRVEGQPNLNIKIDRAKAARYGLNTGDINTVIQAAAGGTTATTVLEGDRQFVVAVRLEPRFRGQRGRDPFHPRRLHEFERHEFLCSAQ